MYEKILDQLIDDMKNFAIISSIVITEDCYSKMTKKEIAHLDSFLSGDLKWLILNDNRKDFFSFRYDYEPIEYEEPAPYELDW